MKNLSNSEVEQNRLLILIKELGLSKKEFAEKINVSLPHLSAYLKKPIMGTKFESKIKNSFPQVNLQWLKYGEGEIFSQETKEIISVYRPIPIYGHVQCGSPVPTWEHAKSHINYIDISTEKDCFGLIARGDSMIPYINPQDILICADRPDKIKDGTAVVVVFKTVDYVEANAKLIIHDGNKEIITLYSINTKYPPTNYSEDEILKIYKLIKIIRNVN